MLKVKIFIEDVRTKMGQKRLQKEINEWLKENPNITIIDRKTNVILDRELSITLFYREGFKEKTTA